MKVVSFNPGKKPSYDNLFAFVKDNKDADVMCFQELNIDDKIKYIMLVDYGFCIDYTSDFLTMFTKIGYLSSCISENEYAVAYEIYTPDGNYNTVIVNVYIPTTLSTVKSQKFGLEQLDETLEYVEGTKKPLIVCGDFNIILRKCDSNSIMYNEYYSKNIFVNSTNNLNEIIDFYELIDPYRGNKYSTHGGSKSEAFGGGARIDRFLCKNIKHCYSDIIDDIKYAPNHRPITLKFAHKKVTT